MCCLYPDRRNYRFCSTIYEATVCNLNKFIRVRFYSFFLFFTDSYIYKKILLSFINQFIGTFFKFFFLQKFYIIT